MFTLDSVLFTFIPHLSAKGSSAVKVNYLRWNLIINPDSFLYVVIELSDLRQVVISDKTD